ncbi:MAG: hypothetical protein ACLQVG_29385 [Terriglobia bacterium]
MSDLHNRRHFLKTSALATLGSAAALNLGDKQLHAMPAKESMVTMPQTFHKGLATGKLGTLTVTRLLLGCNQVSGYSHSRDLNYVDRLMQEYQTDERVLNTWQLCEEQGINALLSDPFEKPVRLMKRYRKERGGKIQWISEVHPEKYYYNTRLADLKEHLKQVIDNEPTAFYIQGGVCDSFVHRGLMDELGEALEIMKKTGLPSGLGAHSVESPKACLKAGLQPDFYMKTYHPEDYWSATPRAQRVEFLAIQDSPDNHDNMWDIKPEATREFMAGVPKPWIAFKVMAAGAIPPEKAFRFAFRGGADFICAGMFDFQVAEDLAIAKKVLAEGSDRSRPWMA